MSLVKFAKFNNIFSVQRSTGVGGHMSRQQILTCAVFVMFSGGDGDMPEMIKTVFVCRKGGVAGGGVT